jgi:hypothetical protein
MINITSHATNGVRILGRKGTHAEIMRMFKNHLTKLRNTLNVSDVLSVDSLCLIVLHRVPWSREMSIPPVMDGRQKTLTVTLLSQGIGSKRRYPCNGKLKVPSLDSPKLTTHIAASSLVVPYSKFSIVLGLHTRSVQYG